MPGGFKVTNPCQGNNYIIQYNSIYCIETEKSSGCESLFGLRWSLQGGFKGDSTERRWPDRDTTGKWKRGRAGRLDEALMEEGGGGDV